MGDLDDLSLDTSHDPYRDRPRHAVRQGNGTTARALRQVGETWEQIADALLRTASSKAIELVGEYVPGFRDNLRRRDNLYDGVTH